MFSVHQRLIDIDVHSDSVCEYHCEKAEFNLKSIQVRGDYFVSQAWLPVFPQREYGGKFELPLEGLDTGDGNVEWVNTQIHMFALQIFIQCETQFQFDFVVSIGLDNDNDRYSV